MIAFGLDDTGDLNFNPDTGVFEMVDGQEEIAQKLYIALGTNLGELDWNEDFGIDQIDMILNGGDQSVIQSIISDYLEDWWSDTFESVEVTGFKVDKQKRLTSLTATVTLEDGTTVDASAALDDEEGDDDDADNS